MNGKYEHLVDLSDITVEQVDRIVDLAIDIYKHPDIYRGACSNRILATLFYEPSTRTQMSFQTAMIKLGGSIIGFDNPQNSSVVKGENYTDTIRIVSGYADILAVRHPLEGAAKAAAMYADCPVINAGDGGHLHPTQTLTDLVTMKCEIGRLDNLVIGLCGDLINGRTVHSLVKAMVAYPNNRFVFISTPELAMPRYIKDILDANGCGYTEVNSLEDAIPELDVLYMTRIQQERFASEEEYLAQKYVYVLDKAKIFKAKPTLKVMHPLPRIDEIDMEVDEDERAIYFKQAKYGVYARMALILTLLHAEPSYSLIKGEETGYKCTNPRCITNQEHYLKHYYTVNGDIHTCEYCDNRQLI